MNERPSRREGGRGGAGVREELAEVQASKLNKVQHWAHRPSMRRPAAAPMYVNEGLAGERVGGHRRGALQTQWQADKRGLAGVNTGVCEQRAGMSKGGLRQGGQQERASEGALNFFFLSFSVTKT